MKSALFLLAILAQAQSTKIAFEAATVKPNNSGRLGGGINRMPARIRVINASLKLCIEFAFDVRGFQIAGGPGWLDTDRFDIDAVAAEPFKDGEDRAMLQSLLADRFGLAIHRETQDRAGYALVPGRNGAKLTPAKSDDPSSMFSSTESGDITWSAPAITMSRMAEALSGRIGLKVVDQTGIEGKFDVSLQWTPDAGTGPRLSKSGEPLPAPPADAIPGPTLFTAIQEKLGLKLESKKVPVEVIVVDRATRPSEN